jgi:hypothetical protein
MTSFTHSSTTSIIGVRTVLTDPVTVSNHAVSGVLLIVSLCIMILFDVLSSIRDMMS